MDGLLFSLLQEQDRSEAAINQETLGQFDRSFPSQRRFQLVRCL